MTLNPLFQSLLDCGTEMEIALRNLNVDRFEELVAVRQSIIDSLQEIGPPSVVDPQWREVASALEKQERLIMAEVARCQTSLSKALESSSRLQHASQSYGNDGRTGGLLHRSLSA